PNPELSAAGAKVIILLAAVRHIRAGQRPKKRISEGRAAPPSLPEGHAYRNRRQPDRRGRAHRHRALHLRAAGRAGTPRPAQLLHAVLQPGARGAAAARHELPAAAHPVPTAMDSRATIWGAAVERARHAVRAGARAAAGRAATAGHAHGRDNPRPWLPAL